MPLEIGIWRIDQKLARLQPAVLDLESRLEDILEQDIAVASTDWLVIGRQVATPFGKRIDLLAIDRDGNLVVLELKRDKTEREIITQVLDYGSWIRTLRAEDIAPIFNEYRKRRFPNDPALSIDEAFCQRFKTKEMPEELNERHELVVVGSSFDPATERIVNYLTEEYGVNINAIFFRVFRDEGREYLTRAWLRDSQESSFLSDSASSPGRAAVPHPKTDWNGEYYVSFGHDDRRHWEDAIKYGFISAGGGAWYSNTLDLLQPGDRVWANVPGFGFVGVGEVQGPKTKVDQFQVSLPNGTKGCILEMSDLKAKDMGSDSENLERAEYLVPVKWLKVVPLSSAIKEKGFFGNQNSVARPKDAKWAYTVERLKERFGVSDPADPETTSNDVAVHPARIAPPAAPTTGG